jgi:hypothetical protein
MGRMNKSGPQGHTMKIIKVQMELAVDEALSHDKYLIADYLNNKLFMDPEFFNEFVLPNFALSLQISKNLIAIFIY